MQMALKSKLSRLLPAGEPGLSDPPLDHVGFIRSKFQLGQTDKITQMVEALNGGALAGQLVVFATSGTSAVSGS